MKTRILLPTLALLLLGTPLPTIEGTALANPKDRSAEKQAEKPKGPPIELKQLGFLGGEWNVREVRKDYQTGEVKEGTAFVSFKTILDGAAIEEVYKYEHNGQKMASVSWITFNRQDSNWEAVSLHSASGRLMHYYDGELKDGMLTLYTEKRPKDGEPIRVRWSVKRVDDKRLEGAVEIFKDNNWQLVNQQTFTRK